MSRLAHPRARITATASRRRVRAWLASITTAMLALSAMVGTWVPASATPAPDPAFVRAFTLHSNPGAEFVIFLDFDGATVDPDLWPDKVVPAEIPGWSPADDGESWGPEELAFVEEAWATLADRYSPWIVDVTTEDPGPDARGGHVVLTPSDDWSTEAFDGHVAGSEFGSAIGVAKPSFLFMSPGWSPRSVANIAAHEVGHTFGVHHASGIPTYGEVREYQEYSQGQMVDIWKPVAGWNPIMGGGDGNLAQWSKGDFPGAIQKQDALAQISTYLERRDDEAPSGSADAIDLPIGPAYITSEEDIDSWTLGTCMAGSTVAVTPVVEYSSLDVAIALVRRGETTPELTANPLTYSTYDMDDPEYNEIFLGLDASLTVPADGADYVLQVRGGGNGYWETGGYGPYGSIGGYTIDVEGCDGLNAGVEPASALPGAPWALESAFTGISGDKVRILWSKPWASGASEITEYIVARQPYSPVTGEAYGAVTQVLNVPGDEQRAVVTDQPTGTYVFHVQSVNSEGESPSATTGPFAFGPEVQISAPVIVAASNRVGEVVSIEPLTVVPGDAALSYQWRHRAATVEATKDEWRDIPGATSATYTLTTAEIGEELSVEVTATSADHRTTSASSLASAPVIGVDAAGEVVDFGAPRVGRFRVTDFDPTHAVRNMPRDLAIDDAGYVYVPANLDDVDGNERIQKFSPSGDLVATWDAAPPGKWPTSIMNLDVGPDGYIRAFDSNHRQVHVYSSEGALRESWEAVMPEEIQRYPIHVITGSQAWVTVDDDGNSYISDPAWGAISRFDPSGVRTALWDVSDDRNRQYHFGSVGGMRTVTVDGETTLYYTHAETSEIRALNADGDLVGSWPVDGLFEQSDLTADVDGNLYVIVRTGMGPDEVPASWVRHYTPEFELIDEYRVWGIDVTGVELGARGQIYAAKNQFDSEIQMLAADGYPYGVPAAPEVTATAGDGMVTVTWSAAQHRPDFPLHGAAPYTVSLGGQTYQTSNTTHQFTGLQAGVEYTATVVANNPAGSSAAATAKATPYGAPSAPTGVQVTPGDGQATVTWEAALDNGRAVTSYTVTTWPATSTLVVEDGRTAVVSGLTNGVSYNFFVTATNEAGTSPSSTVTGTPFGSLSAPRSLVATPGVLQVELVWQEPTGGTVSYYTVEIVGGGETVTEMTTAPYFQFFGTPGMQYTFTVTAHNDAGASEAATVKATPLDWPLENFTSSPTPTVSGTKKVGSTLEANPGAWTPDAKLTYQWYRGSAKISGADQKRYVTTATDLGKSISVEVTGAKTGYSTKSVRSAASTIASGTFTAPSPTISGTAKVGSVLTANAGTWKPTATLKYQWYRGTAAIAGATAKTYRLVTADNGKSITVKVTGTKSGYTSLTKTSAGKKISAGTLTAATPTITGTLKAGKTLTAKPGTWKAGTSTKVAFKYQWYVAGKAVSGATKSTFKVPTSAKGKTVSVKVTGSATGYTTLAKTSATKKIAK